MSAPSRTAYGLRWSSKRSLYEPGSPSAAFTTTVVGKSSESAALERAEPLPSRSGIRRRPARAARRRRGPRSPPSGPSLRAASSPEPLPPKGASPGRSSGAAGRTRSSDMPEVVPAPSCGEPRPSRRLPTVSEHWRDVFHHEHGMRDYDEILVPRMFTPWGDILLDTVGVDAANIALDVACGPGSVTRLLSERVGPTGRVTGADLSPAMLEIARERGAPHEGGADRLGRVPGRRVAGRRPRVRRDRVPAGTAVLPRQAGRAARDAPRRSSRRAARRRVLVVDRRVADVRGDGARARHLLRGGRRELVPRRSVRRSPTATSWRAWSRRPGSATCASSGSRCR